jgi:hypothetical protein
LENLEDFARQSHIGKKLVSPANQPKRLDDCSKIIPDGQVWIDMLNHRNLLAHTYDFTVFEEAIQAAENRYLPTLHCLHDFFVQELTK